MRIVQLVTLIFILFGCRKKTDELLGHWHSVPLEDGYFWTLDITDSTTQVNKFDVLNGDQAFRRFDKDGNEAIVFWEEVHENFQVRNDTLILNEFSSFVRFADNNHMNDSFLGSLVQLNLPRSTANSQTDLLKGKQWAPILVGRPKNSQTIDSIRFQPYDVTIGFNDLTRFAQIEADKWSDPHYWLVIYADSSSSQNSIDSLRTILDPFEFIDGFIVSRFNYDLDQLEYEELNGR